MELPRNHFPKSVRATIVVFPAQAGTQWSVEFWVPACAGMTKLEIGKSIRDYSFMNRPSSFPEAATARSFDRQDVACFDVKLHFARQAIVNS